MSTKQSGMDIALKANELLITMKELRDETLRAEGEMKKYFERYRLVEAEYNELKNKAPELVELLEKEYEGVE